MSEPDPLPTGYTLDSYEVSGEAGLTGFGRLYTARDTNLGDAVVLCVLSPEQRSTARILEFREAFRRAFQSRRGQVHAYGEWEGIPYAVLAPSGAALADPAHE